ncbi:MAG: helix-hairpin-helix domain-containing protein [Faecalimonas sp.]|nr:helix-hairpin-helix domain-containing protein [Faecalimonas sp.]
MRRSKIGMLALLLLLTACGAKEEEQLALAPVEEQAELAAEEEKTQKKTIFVYVCGAVQRPGVYELPEGSRVYEAILQAGDFTEQAARWQVNQAEILEDESSIYVPTVEEAAAETAVTGQSAKEKKVNLNTATKEELMTLTGVGEAKAEQIIRYRKEHGRFQTIEEIMQISGIKEGLFEKIKENITV